MKIASLPLNGLARSNEDIAKHLEETAQQIRDDACGDLRNLYLIMECEDGRIVRSTCGQPCDLARALGIYFIAAVRAADGTEK